MVNKLLADFADPPAAFRGAPFWSLNGKLEAPEIRRQIRRMKTMGFGGCFFHSRSGMETPYLSARYFRLLAAAIDEAKKRDIRLWLYDEDRWPSGAAGGLATRDPRFRVRYLACRTMDAPDAGEGATVALFAVRFRADGALVSSRQISLREKPFPDEVVLRCSLRIGADDPWFNGQSYLDVLDSRAVEKFCSVTHDAYFRACGNEFGKCVPGIFTDEPNFNAIPPGKNLPWTPKFPAAFRRKFGYDLRDRLPELFFPLADNVFSKARLDYRIFLTELFDRAFAGTVAGRCRRYGLEMTGHLFGEDTLGKQVRNVGGAMRFYEKMTMPGIDLLTENALVFNTVKQCVSAARQLGKKRKLTELYGCTGWDFSFAGYRALGEWQYALGINFRCLHHALYTLKGAAKRDYPASISYQSPWFKDFRAVEDPFARLGAALAPGGEVRDLLVIQNLESVFGRTVDASEPPENDRLAALTDRLLALHLDFDFGDEKILAETGKIAGNIFRIGRADYRAVLVPETLTLRRTTLRALKKFAASGGGVFYLGQAPEYLDGEKSETPGKEFSAFRKIDDATLDDALSPLVRHIRIADKNSTEIAPALYLLKQGRGFETLFICNTSVADRTHPFDVPRVADRKLAFPDGVVRWKIPASYKIYRLDPDSGKRYAVSVQRQGENAVFPCPLAALESALFLATENSVDALSLPEKKCTGRRIPLPDTPMRVFLDEPNVLVLDRPRCTADAIPVPGKTFLQIDAALRTMLGATPRENDAVQPWCRPKRTAAKSVGIELLFDIECRRVPGGTCFLALEDPGLYRITFNGFPLPCADAGFWCDRAIRKIAIAPEFFRPGKNELRLKRRYDASQPGLESIFLLGDFSVFGDALDEPVRELRFGDWTKQGLPYYAGNVAYRIKLPSDAKRIVFGKWKGTALKIRAGKNAPRVLFRDFADIRRVREITVTVLGSRRNALGPFYFDDGNAPGRRGAPAQFASETRTEKSLAGYGLCETPHVLLG
ncbi:MAG: hypothetical protein MJ016_04655 [Victivallaceae bacterium]|nr:hypothetical protein [Victivallaceae bacterium]